MGMGPRRAALPQRLILALLVAPALLSGCREPETYVELGPSFAPVVPPPGRAQVYVYWPAGSPPVRGAYHLWGSLFEQLLPGGYVSEPVAPGEVRVGVGRTWKLGRDGDLTSAGVPGPELAFRAEAGRVYYLEAVPRPGLVDDVALAAVPAAVAQGALRGCRQVRWKDEREAAVASGVQGHR
jgi:hypothetical protein